MPVEQQCCLILGHGQCLQQHGEWAYGAVDGAYLALKLVNLHHCCYGLGACLQPFVGYFCCLQSRPQRFFWGKQALALHQDRAGLRSCHCLAQLHQGLLMARSCPSHEKSPTVHWLDIPALMAPAGHSAADAVLHPVADLAKLCHKMRCEAFVLAPHCRGFLSTLEAVP